MKGRLATALAVLAAPTLILLAPASASATTRYAHPDGTGTAMSSSNCTNSDETASLPFVCSMPTALSVAVAGDEVILRPDTVGGDPHGPLLAQQVVPAGVLLRGPNPAEPARVFSPGGAFFPLRLATGAALQDVVLTVSNTGIPNSGLEIGGGTRVERVFVEAKWAGLACRINGSGAPILIRDSACWTNDGSNARAIEMVATPTVTLRNVTAAATGPLGNGIRALGGTASTPLNVYATNTIALGDDAGTNRDVYAEGDGTPGSTNIFMDHSNHSSINALNGGTVTAPGTNGNVTTPPVFVAEEVGGLAQEPTSAGTIDRGVSASVNGVGLGSAQLGGGARCLGATPDIGAYEFTGSPCPIPATSVTPLTVPTATTPAAPKKCKKGRKLKKGRCVKKKRKKS